MSETPSQEIIAAANVKVAVTDSRGRSIEIRKLKTLDTMRLFEIIGSENSKNLPYLGFAMLAYGVVSIDGRQILRPATKLALETIIQTLDDDGFDAVAQGMKKHFQVETKSEDEAMDAVKNA
jgi:hypothetical protein